MSKPLPQPINLESVNRKHIIELLEGGHPPDLLSINNETLLTHLSRNCKNAELPLYLLAYGANPFTQNAQRETAHSLVSSKGFEYLCRLYELDPEIRSQTAYNVIKKIPTTSLEPSHYQQPSTDRATFERKI